MRILDAYHVHLVGMYGQCKTPPCPSPGLLFAMRKRSARDDVAIEIRERKIKDIE